MESTNSSVHTTPSLSGTAHFKIDVDAHFDLSSSAESSHQPKDEAPASLVESPPPFSAHNFPSRYFPNPSAPDPYRALVTACQDPLASPDGRPAPPFEETQGSASASGEGAVSSVLAETKAALPRDTKDRQGGKEPDDGEPPPPYTEGSSPLDGFTYIMASAGSIITQVQQGGPAPLNTALGGGMFCLQLPRVACTDYLSRLG